MKVEYFHLRKRLIFSISFVKPYMSLQNKFDLQENQPEVMSQSCNNIKTDFVKRLYVSHEMFLCLNTLLRFKKASSVLIHSSHRLLQD